MVARLAVKVISSGFAQVLQRTAALAIFPCFHPLAAGEPMTCYLFGA
jgi:hypothetical protein